MAFSALLYIFIGLFILCVFIWRKPLPVFLITFLIILPSSFIVSPLHFTKHFPDKEEREKSFSLLTYNTMAFLDFEGKLAPGEPNRTLQYILDVNPDILCLQEIYREAGVNTLNITTGQRNLRDLRYPYQLHWHSSAVAIFSKYPIKEIEIGDDPRMPWAHYKAARIYLKDDSITVINCHLQSLGLDVADKNLYQKLTEGSFSVDSVGKTGGKILTKLNSAFINRAIQADWIRNVLDNQITGNVIVCGDFNDVPLSYATRVIKGNDMKDVYERTGLGPHITFHDNKFYFRIDHAFYRGNFAAYYSRIDKHPSSDHYPLLINFRFDKTNDSFTIL